MARRIGLLTLPLHTNYGGILQVVALYGLLAGQGREVTLFRTGPDRPVLRLAIAELLRRLPFQNIGGLRARHREIAAHAPFLKRYLPRMTRILRNRAQLSAEVRERGLEVFIVGSDQVWRSEFRLGTDFANYFLDFVGNEVGKVAYAASFGHSRWQEGPDMTARIASFLARFRMVGVREETGVEICRETFGRTDAKLVLDPTLLMPAGFYGEMIGAPRQSSGKVLMKYVLDPVKELGALEASALEALGHGATVRGIYLDRQERQATVPEWLRAFRDADFVLTDSFHGMAFSIIFGKQFVALVNAGRGEDRFLSLARQLGLEDRLVFTGGEGSWPARAIDYAEVAVRLERRRAESLAVLMEAMGE